MNRKAKPTNSHLPESKLTREESIALLRRDLDLLNSAIEALERLAFLQKPKPDIKPGRKAKTARRVR